MGTQKPVNQAPQWLQSNVLKSSSSDARSTQAVTIYTILTILMRMKSDFGFEAMLEYIEKYLRTIEAHNPEIRSAVDQSIQIVNLHKIYKEVDHA